MGANILSPTFCHHLTIKYPKPATLKMRTRTFFPLRLSKQFLAWFRISHSGDTFMYFDHRLEHTNLGLVQFENQTVT